MTDVQSNARRIIFTALANFVFWVLAWRAYTEGLGFTYSDSAILEALLSFPDDHKLSGFLIEYAWAVAGLTLAVLPTLFLWISTPRKHRHRGGVFACGLLFALSTSHVFLRGDADFLATCRMLGPERPFEDLLQLAERSHSVSWLWLLFPIILTTAIVIAETWRQALRDGKDQAMTDHDCTIGRVSNARRCLFTALTVVAFWTMSFASYRVASSSWSDQLFVLKQLDLLPAMDQIGVELPLVALALALIPAWLCFLASHVHLAETPEQLVRAVALALVCVIGFCYWLGTHDATVAFDIHTTTTSSPGSSPAPTVSPVVTRLTHNVSWFPLLVPIILTTTFVIFGAWRRAVRDAEVATDEDE